MKVGRENPSFLPFIIPLVLSSPSCLSPAFIYPFFVNLIVTRLPMSQLRRYYLYTSVLYSRQNKFYEKYI